MLSTLPATASTQRSGRHVMPVAQVGADIRADGLADRRSTDHRAQRDQRGRQRRRTARQDLGHQRDRQQAAEQQADRRDEVDHEALEVAGDRVRHQHQANQEVEGIHMISGSGRVTVSSQGCSQPRRSNRREMIPPVNPHSGTLAADIEPGPFHPEGWVTLNRFAGSMSWRIGWWMIAPTSAVSTGCSCCGSRQ